MFSGAAAAAAYHSATRLTATQQSGSTQDLGARSEVEALRQKVERQALLIQTLLMILLEKKVLHEEEFKEWLDYVDQLDGTRDGKLKEDRSPQACSNCGRNSPRNAPKCLYCGHAFETDFLYYRPGG
jgi:hypothetical protein